MQTKPNDVMVGKTTSFDVDAGQWKGGMSFCDHEPVAFISIRDRRGKLLQETELCCCGAQCEVKLS